MDERRTEKGKRKQKGEAETPAADEREKLEQLQAAVDAGVARSKKTKAAKIARQEQLAPLPANTKVESFRKLAAALKRHGVFRTHKTIHGYATGDVRWFESGFPKKAPWFEHQLPAIARWISEHYSETRETGQEEKRPKQKGDKDFAEGSLDDVRDLIEKKGLSEVDKWARLMYTIEKATNAKIDRLIKEQKYVKVEDIETADAKKRNSIKRGLEQLAKGMRQPLADETDPAKVEAMLTQAFRNLCNAGFGGKW